LASLTLQAAEPRRVALSHLTGRLYLADDATVRVFTPVSGQVRQVDAVVGQRVDAGAALAEIDSPDYGQALSDARAAEANGSAAARARARAEDLFAHGAVAAKDVEAAQAAAAVAQAERERTAARLQLYHGRVGGAADLFVLRSPLAGVVVEKNINPGQEVRSDQMLANAANLVAPLFVVSDPSRLWLQIDAAETDLADLQPGQEVRVEAKAFPGRAFAGRIAEIGPSLDPVSRTVRARGVVENADGMLKAEMYVTVDVIRQVAQVPGAGVEIPSTAIFTLGNQAYLFVQLAPGRFERRAVEVGAEQDGKVPVRAGVAAGQIVVTEGGLLLEALIDPNP
jgi:cobalt-zinc-cadmium efflux system membrane fusion protein